MLLRNTYPVFFVYLRRQYANIAPIEYIIQHNNENQEANHSFDDIIVIKRSCTESFFPNVPFRAQRGGEVG